jgi:hypothetical protein
MFDSTRQPYRSIYNGYGLDTLEQGYAIEWRRCQRKWQGAGLAA